MCLRKTSTVTVGTPSSLSKFESFFGVLNLIGYQPWRTYQTKASCSTPQRALSAKNNRRTGIIYSRIVRKQLMETRKSVNRWWNVLKEECSSMQDVFGLSTRTNDSGKIETTKDAIVQAYTWVVCVGSIYINN
ncbi:hypothetical protein OSB04_002972 [Centaurea solstitialis]|uniref:Uncharacterized protein n=1 Tax=Centaurea solstitialis TaxID=347529 RepID=A0AA38WVI6_9ASTR|nr:hypothetical protein OSB04_002972 [Centaurea solstitialis]